MTKSEITQSLLELQETWDEQIKVQILLAKLIRAKYLALRTEGFTDAQALEICRQ